MLHAIRALPGEVADMAKCHHRSMFGKLTPQCVQQTDLQFAEFSHTIVLRDAVGKTLAPHGRVDQKSILVKYGRAGNAVRCVHEFSEAGIYMLIYSITTAFGQCRVRLPAVWSGHVCRFFPGNQVNGCSIVRKLRHQFAYRCGQGGVQCIDWGQPDPAGRACVTRGKLHLHRLDVQFEVGEAVGELL